MNHQESLSSFFSLTEDITETTEPKGTKISKRKRCRLNYKRLLQFLLMMLQIVFQLVILLVEYRRSS
jgi:hypothetical protein